VLGVALVAVALGAPNLAGAVAIRLAGVDAGTRVRVAVTVGAFEGAARTGRSELRGGLVRVGVGIAVAADALG
jgi:hypothetical protein